MKIGTRNSALALWQARHVQDLLAPTVAAELVGMTTTGDQRLDVTLSKVGGKGLFLKELHRALADGSVDCAVHSLKDVPAEPHPEFELVAFLSRHDVRDAFVSNDYADFAGLPVGARVGTSSLRRVAQVRALRSDLVIEPVRGNLQTRLKKLDDGEFDALILASAGLDRLELEQRIRCRLPEQEFVPAVGQGALAIEIRRDDQRARSLLETLDDARVRRCVLAERSIALALGADCTLPVAAYAQTNGDQLSVNALVGDPHNGEVVRANAVAHIGESSAAATVAQQLGQSVANDLLQQGAARLIERAARYDD